MKHRIDINTWVRKEHYQFFRTFESPYYGVTVHVDCTAAYKFSKEAGSSFFLYYLYQALAAAQQVEAFHLRIEEDEVFFYDRVDGGSTVPRENGTFGFAQYRYRDSFEEFLPDASAQMERVRNSTTLERSSANNIIRCSSLPWIDFTSLSHAWSFTLKDSCPRVSFGKMTQKEGRRTMPVAVHVHHALVDGLHVGQYLDCYQDLLHSR